MAEKRAAFIFLRLRSLGFSKCRWLRTSFKVPSRSIFFFSRRNALSTGSPFFSLISVKNSHFLSKFVFPSWIHLKWPVKMQPSGVYVNEQNVSENGRIAPKVLLPGRGVKTREMDTLRQK